jgi:hypothetical protein
MKSVSWSRLAVPSLALRSKSFSAAGDASMAASATMFRLTNNADGPARHLQHAGRRDALIRFIHRTLAS